MSDSDSFIREVTEEVERDRMNRRLKKYGPYVVAGVLLIVGAAAAWNWKQDQDRLAQDERGLLLLSADPEMAIENIDQLSPGAAVLAELRLADTLAARGDTQAAIEHFDKVAATPGAEDVYADLASLRALRLRAIEGAPDELIAEIDPLTAEGRPYRLLALELRAVLLLNAGKTEEAQADMKAILNDPDRTGNLDARVEQLLLASGGQREE
ncbi:tetratricopeptide repeat protein [Rhodobacteraceae bacterium NNCM2]|nr:tetratricopeptide repeat protein [Coraliihabitans acroporae]